MQQPPSEEYINWLQMQEGQVSMEEAQLAAEEQWLWQQEFERSESEDVLALTQMFLFAATRAYYPPYFPYSYGAPPFYPDRRSSWLSMKRRELEGKRMALQGKRMWLQAEKAKYSLT